MSLTPVSSSNLAAVGYDAWSRVLVVAFHGDRVYEHYAVPSREYEGLLRAESHGSYYARHIRNRYSYRRL